MQRRALLVAFEAAPRELDRRLDQIGPGPGREPTVRLLEPREEARDRDRALADVEDLRPRVAEVDQELVHLAEARASARRRSSRAPSSRRSGSCTSRKPPPAGPVSGPSVTKRRERGGEERVDRVPALAQHARPGLGGQRVTRGDRPSHRDEGTAPPRRERAIR